MLPTIIDLQAIAGIGALILMVIQYVKDAIPEKLVRVCAILAGIGVSFLWFYKPGADLDFVVIIANGVFAAIGADTGYQFLSPTGSPTWSLPAQASKTTVVTPEVAKTQ